MQLANIGANIPLTESYKALYSLPYSLAHIFTGFTPMHNSKIETAKYFNEFYAEAAKPFINRYSFGVVSEDSQDPFIPETAVFQATFAMDYAINHFGIKDMIAFPKSLLLDTSEEVYKAVDPSEVSFSTTIKPELKEKLSNVRSLQDLKGLSDNREFAEIAMDVHSVVFRDLKDLTKCSVTQGYLSLTVSCDYYYEKKHDYLFFSSEHKSHDGKMTMNFKVQDFIGDLTHLVDPDEIARKVLDLEMKDKIKITDAHVKFSWNVLDPIQAPYKSIGEF